MTAVCVPMLALAPLLGGAGLTVAAVLILLERTGKAVRSPSKSVLLADAAAGVGRGKGIRTHVCELRICPSDQSHVRNSAGFEPAGSRT